MGAYGESFPVTVKVNTMNSIFRFAQAVDQDWQDNQAIDWSQAEALVDSLRSIEAAVVIKLPGITSIIDYAVNTEDWDSCYVASWPGTVMEDFASAGMMRLAL